jgi:hypothetical protein
MERNELAPHIDEEALHADSAARVAPQDATAAVRESGRPRRRRPYSSKVCDLSAT